MHLFDKGGEYYHSVMNILDTYSFNRPDVGYVQGMSYLVGMLLFQMDEYNAFQCFTNLLSRKFFFTLYNLNIKQLVRYFRIYDLLFSIHLPDLFACFKKEKITSQVYLLDWFFTIFCKIIPFKVACRVWDCYFLLGESFLFQTALGILRANRKKLLSYEYEERLVNLKTIGMNIDEETLFSNIRHINIPNYVHKLLKRLN